MQVTLAGCIGNHSLLKKRTGQILTGRFKSFALSALSVALEVLGVGVVEE